MNNQIKGYLLAFTSVISVSIVFIFSKAALNEISLPQFGTYWFGFGLIWIFIYGIKNKSFDIVKSFNKRKYILLLTLGIIEIIATTFFFKAIHTIPNPAITSFLSNISPVFVLTLSFVVLNERLNKLEIFGVILALTGAFIIGYKGGFEIKNMFIDGTQYVIIASLMFAISSVISKKNIISLSPVFIALNRTFFLFLFSLIVLYFQKTSIVIPSSALKNIIIGSVLGPFLTAVTGLLALKYIDLSKKSIISSTKSLFVLVGAYLYFGVFPKTFELIGGFLSIFGVLLIIFGKSQLSRSRP
ncbi:MAG: DMT family transporter [Flavobacteriaceae bacterium]|nr:DMT family transporter [Flavobacteriaceae bacterium]